MRLVDVLALVVPAVLLSGCREDGKPDGTDPDPDTGTATQGADEDGDGFSAAQGDCDDGDAAINPNAPEVCDGVDQDCDGEADDGLGGTFYADSDGDGRGASGSSYQGCAPPEGYVEDGTDCDDAQPAVYPGASELCDGLDNDCDGEADEGVAETFYADSDGDGAGDPASAITACDQPPGAVEIGGDCDDGDATISPGAIEVCDEQDNDCDGQTDEDVAATFYADLDGDGYGSILLPQAACALPEGYVADWTDCDDGAASVNPGAPELCDGIDNDCDGQTDDGAGDAAIWYADADSDGFGDAGSATAACAAPPGYTSDATDCDDRAAAIFPGAAELCDSLDNDCDGQTDEADATDASIWYLDADRDGYGNPYVSQAACAQPGGYVADGTDCNDSAAASNPGAAEVCDNLDNDCDGDADEDSAVDALVWYADQDRDSFGDPALPRYACDQPAGYSANDLDCDDGSLSNYPGAPEYCDGVDNDCDGAADDSAVDARDWYADADSDGYGDPGASARACTAPVGYGADGTDCDDGDMTVFPGAPELCNGVDDDCDRQIDEAGAVGAGTWYRDADGDGYGDPLVSSSGCSQPAGYLTDRTDCDDADASIHPGAPDRTDGVDGDCDGIVDDGGWAGTGADGALTVTGTTLIGESWPLASISGDTLTVTGSPTLAPGDEILVINLHGTDAAHGSVGRYEFFWVSAVSGDDITVEAAPTVTFGQTSNADLSGQAIQVVRVPQYTDVTVRAGGLLTAPAWDGQTGGVLALRATGAVTVESGGWISADELGYAGGATGTATDYDAFQGESYAGSGDGNLPPIGAYYGNWAAGYYRANYGGGGAMITGGGGNYGGGATSGASWDGGNYPPAAAGGTYGQADLGLLFFGSGGAGVWRGNSNPGPGGDGAGIVYIGAHSLSASGAAAISAIGGTTPYWATGTWTYGAGGGAGGSIWVIADSLTLSADSVDAGGGFGESTHIRRGGDGGVGRVRLDYNSLNGAAYGSAAATSAATSAAIPDAGYSVVP